MQTCLRTSCGASFEPPRSVLARDFGNQRMQIRRHRESAERRPVYRRASYETAATRQKRCTEAYMVIEGCLHERVNRKWCLNEKPFSWTVFGSKSNPFIEPLWSDTASQRATVGLVCLLFFIIVSLEEENHTGDARCTWDEHALPRGSGLRAGTLQAALESLF